MGTNVLVPFILFGSSIVRLRFMLDRYVFISWSWNDKLQHVPLTGDYFLSSSLVVNAIQLQDTSLEVVPSPKA